MSFTSPFPDVSVPDVSLYDYLFGDLTDAERETVALIDAGSGAYTTYGELIAQVEALAADLAGRGVAPNDVVALLAPNSPQFVITFHAILRAGATVTPVNVLYTADEISRQLSDSRARLIVSASALIPIARAAADEANACDLDLIDLEDALSDLAPPPATWSAPAIDPGDQLAVLPYSSGTTGNAKGVMLTHRNLVANITQITPYGRIDATHRVLSVIPFFHIYGLTVLVNAALYGRARQVTMPKFDLAAFLDAIQTHACTHLYIAPPIALALAKHPMLDGYDLSSVVSIVSGAASLNPELGHAVAQRLNCHVTQGYGMTELSPVSHMVPNRREDTPTGQFAPLSSCGWPVPNTVNKLVDVDTGREIELPRHGMSAPGELWIKGPNVMVGYLGNEAATGETIDGDGFLHTGDLATVDATRCIYLVDRLKELIKYKGYQVAPAELETVLMTHPAIVDAAVVAGRDAESGEEVPRAFVVCQPGATATADEIIEFVSLRVAPHKKVRQLVFIDAVPKSAAGKILRRQLRTTQVPGSS